eukprot:jgi/Phyca11/20028/fgenesh1_pg.PHYCAscaffold_55_\
MASPVLSIPYLRLVLAGGTVLTYTNPKPWACLKISGCSYWHRTSTLYWKNLATNHYGIFYENDNCNTDSEYFFASDIANPAAIGVYEKEEAFTNVDNCPKDKENVVLNESGVYVTSASEDGSFVDGDYRG